MPGGCVTHRWNRPGTRGSSTVTFPDGRSSFVTIPWQPPRPLGAKSFSPIRKGTRSRFAGEDSPVAQTRRCVPCLRLREAIHRRQRIILEMVVPEA